MTVIEDSELDRLLLGAMTPDFEALAAILSRAHDSFDDWSEAALARSLDRLVVLRARGAIDLDGDPKEPLEASARLRPTEK